MPYIKSDKRELILTKRASPKGWEKHLIINEVTNAGELNYAITELILNYFRNKNKNYQAINDIVGALEGAKAEFQRKVVTPYEEEKIKENGDID